MASPGHRPVLVQPDANRHAMHGLRHGRTKILEAMRKQGMRQNRGSSLGLFAKWAVNYRAALLYFGIEFNYGLAIDNGGEFLMGSK